MANAGSSPVERAAAQTMVAAANLGEFKYGPGDSPWYGAQFASGDDALRAHAVAQRLDTDELPRLLTMANELVSGTHLRPFATINELGELLSEGDLVVDGGNSRWTDDQVRAALGAVFFALSLSYVAGTTKRLLTQR